MNIESYQVVINTLDNLAKFKGQSIIRTRQRRWLRFLFLDMVISDIL